MPDPDGGPDHPSGSREQRDAEPLILAGVAEVLGTLLAPRRLHLPGGTSVDVDGVGEDPLVLVEVYAHQGALRGSQPKKLATDALKLDDRQGDAGTWRPAGPRPLRRAGRRRGPPRLAGGGARHVGRRGRRRRARRHRDGRPGRGADPADHGHPASGPERTRPDPTRLQGDEGGP